MLSAKVKTKNIYIHANGWVESSNPDLNLILC